MACCGDFEEGQVYTCPECGVEIQVIKSCEHEEGEACSTEECRLVCCGEEMVLKD